MTVTSILIGLLFALAFAGLSYALLASLREGLAAYEGVYSQDTAREFEDLFLFIPAKRIADIARVAAAVLFALGFLLFGGFGSSGEIGRGLLFGGALAGVALAAPGQIARHLRARRLARFNRQLVDSLVSMSSALRAGFSILQAFEQIVKQGENPIAQEMSLFLQQVRVGVRFEEALRNMETRVGSEDLLLMNQSIEIARQTGGNLTEVFDKIAATIRERMRIQLRIRSLTAMGRLQGLVVGLMPVALLFFMTMIDPRMMTPFFQSKMGIGVLVATGLLEALGFLAIRKVTDIRV